MTSTHQLGNALSRADLDAACRLGARSRSTAALHRELKDAGLDADADRSGTANCTLTPTPLPGRQYVSRSVRGPPLADDPRLTARESAAMPFTVLVGAVNGLHRAVPVERGGA